MTRRRVLPALALSVRQPWAWAILQGGKDVENRTAASVRLGRMREGPVAIHAARGMTRAEYDAAADFMAALGVDCPPPVDLPRGAIVGEVRVANIVSASPSPWFFGPRGLVLERPRAVDPIPADGALGFFLWKPNGGALAAPLQWMRPKPATPSAPQLPL